MLLSLTSTMRTRGVATSSRRADACNVSSAISATVSTCIVSSADDGGRSPYLTGPTGWSAQDPRAAFFAFLAARFSFRLADDAFLIFFPPFSFDAIRGLLTDCGQSGRAAPIVYRGRLQRQQRH